MHTANFRPQTITVEEVMWMSWWSLLTKDGGNQQRGGGGVTLKKEIKHCHKSYCGASCYFRAFDIWSGPQKRSTRGNGKITSLCSSLWTSDHQQLTNEHKKQMPIKDQAFLSGGRKVELCIYRVQFCVGLPLCCTLRWVGLRDETQKSEGKSPTWERENKIFKSDILSLQNKHGCN